jgi:hypothetical protein
MARQTNKVIGTMIIKLINGHKTYWDEHLPFYIFFIYNNIDGSHMYTPYHLIYTLNRFMLVEYVLPINSKDHKDANPIQMLTRIIFYLEKLQGDKLHLEKTT